jgi:hypothetical protein
VSSQLEALAALPPGKEHLVTTLNRRMGGSQSQCGGNNEEKNPCPCEDQTLVIQPIAHHYTLFEAEVLLQAKIYIEKN